MKFLHGAENQEESMDIQEYRLGEFVEVDVGKGWKMGEVVDTDTVRGVYEVLFCDCEEEGNVSWRRLRRPKSQDKENLEGATKGECCTARVLAMLQEYAPKQSPKMRRKFPECL
jgi:hypothetical protein